MAWLEKSLVGELFSTADFSTLTSKLRGVWSRIYDIKEHSSLMVLVSFVSLEDRNSTLDVGLELVFSFFFDIRPWNISD